MCDAWSCGRNDNYFDYLFIFILIDQKSILVVTIIISRYYVHIVRYISRRFSINNYYHTRLFKVRPTKSFDFSARHFVIASNTKTKRYITRHAIYGSIVCVSQCSITVVSFFVRRVRFGTYSDRQSVILVRPKIAIRIGL